LQMVNGYDILIIVLVVWNAITFLIMGIDKYKACKDRRRIRESTLITMAFLFGSIGTFLGMLVFRHKIRKTLFIIMVPIAIVVNVLLLTLINIY
jgi:uncharacterized membrane protein YsdA (DUF1294 family)